MASLQRARLSLSEEYKIAITPVESETKPLMVAEKYAVPRNTIPTWLPPGNKEKLKVLFNLVRIAQKGKTWGSGRIRIWRKHYFNGFQECEWTIFQLVRPFPKKKLSAKYKNSKLRNFMLQMGGLKDGRRDSIFLSKLLLEKRLAHGGKRTCLQFCYDLHIYNAIIYNI